jgi:hypothetical protein
MISEMEDKSEIAVLDIAARKVSLRIALPGCARPSGLAYDAKDDLLITSCRNSVAKIVEAKTGREVGKSNSCLQCLDCVAKLFFGVRTKFCRGAGAFTRKLCRGSHDQPDF